MKNTFTLLSLFICLSASAQWSSLNSGLLAQKDQTMLSGTYFTINYPNGVQNTSDFTNWSASNSGLPVDGSNIFAESLGSNGVWLFCGTHEGGYRSDDGGATWSIGNGQMPFSSTEFVKKYYHLNGNMYAVLNTDVGTGGGLYISTNNGNTWFGAAGGMGSNATIYSIMEHDGVLYANSDVTLYTSTDWGTSWTAHPHFNYAVYAFWANNAAMVASTTIGFERSTDGGNTWTTITGPDGLTSGGEMQGVPGQIFMIGNGGSPGMWMSTDDGMTWAAENTGISAVDQTTLYQFLHIPGTLYVGAITEGYSRSVPVTSIDELDLNTAFSAYFDQGADAITIRRNTEMNDNVLASLYDLTGRQIEVVQVQDKLTTFNTTGLNTGIYIVQLELGNGRSTPIKVIVP